MTKKFDIQWYTFIISYCYLHGENKRIKEKLDLMFVYLRFKTYKHTPWVLFILRKFIYTFKYQCPNYQSMLHFINVLNFTWIPCWNKVICDSGKVSSICSRPVNLQNQWMIKAILGRDRTQVSVRFHSAQYGENPPTWGISGWYHWEILQRVKSSKNRHTSWSWTLHEIQYRHCWWITEVVPVV